MDMFTVRMDIIIKIPSEKEFQQICNYIREFELDDRGLKQEEFIAAFRNNELVGFGRLRKHSDSTELCSLGVVTPHRRQGIGKALVKELILRSASELYLVCIIPEFFTPFGFAIVAEFPTAIQEKLDYCTDCLVVPEKYVVMKMMC